MFENNVQSKVAMTNLGLLKIGVKENSNSSTTGCSIMTVKKYLFISQAILILMTSEGWQNFPSIGTF